MGQLPQACYLLAGIQKKGADDRQSRRGAMCFWGQKSPARGERLWWGEGPPGKGGKEPQG